MSWCRCEPGVRGDERESGEESERCYKRGRWQRVCCVVERGVADSPDVVGSSGASEAAKRAAKRECKGGRIGVHTRCMCARRALPGRRTPGRLDVSHARSNLARRRLVNFVMPVSLALPRIRTPHQIPGPNACRDRAQGIVARNALAAVRRMSQLAQVPPLRCHLLLKQRTQPVRVGWLEVRAHPVVPQLAVGVHLQGDWGSLGMCSAPRRPMIPRIHDRGAYFNMRAPAQNCSVRLPGGDN